MAQTYDIGQSYEYNYDRGPLLDFQFPEIPETPAKDFLGLKVRSRLGIAAGLLLNSRWISAYAKLGFDILTYKTVRSSFRACYPLPNWVFVNDRGEPEAPVYAAPFDASNPEKATSAVCFGMPSMAPEIWRDDVRRARKSLAEGQVLIVSVVASPSDSASLDEVEADFCRCAEWAVKSGADVIEANLSCPNVCSREGTIFMDSKVSGRIAGAIGKTPLLLKVGDFGATAKMHGFMRAVAGTADGIVLVNCMVRPVLQLDGTPVFGEKFRNVGVAGRAIHKPSLEAVRCASEVVQRERLGLVVIGVGGVSRISDVADFFWAGASAVLMGSAPMYLPHFAAEAKRSHPDW